MPYAYKKSKTRLMESIRARFVTAFGKVLLNTTDLLTVVSDLTKEQVMAAESMQFVAPPPKIFIGPDAFPPSRPSAPARCCVHGPFCDCAIAIICTIGWFSDAGRPRWNGQPGEPCAGVPPSLQLVQTASAQLLAL